MERQVALVLVVCALLRGACSQSCEFDEHAGKRFLLASARQVLEGSDPSSCRAACCADAACDTAVLGSPADGLAHCFLFSCQGACTLEDDVSGQFKVFTRKNVEHAPGVQVVPLMLDAGTRTEDNKNNSNTGLCLLGSEVGQCKAAFPRFYYDPVNQTCNRFIYGGCGGNSNNFKTIQECEESCRGVTREGQSSHNKGARMAPQTEDEPEEVQTKEMSEEEFAERCSVGPVVGPCKAAFSRWYFNPSSARCESFIYGGCKGNGNNYEKEEQCTSTCAGVKVLPSKKQTPKMTEELKEMSEEEFAERCSVGPVVGPCKAAFSRWYFNPSSARCESFIYGGCNGNSNNYEKEEQCTSTCAEVKVLPSKKQTPKMTEELKELCGVPPDSGPCRAAFPMFYFDPESQSCRKFTYGGCRGNNNRYNSEEDCTNSCVQQVNSEGHERNRWTAAFFLFLTLAGVSFLLLTALLFITLRRNRRNLWRPLSIRSDKVGLLPDSERSSVDSLPLPESPTREA